jgi:hypothetical protein
MALAYQETSLSPTTVQLAAFRCFLVGNFLIEKIKFRQL